MQNRRTVHGPRHHQRWPETRSGQDQRRQKHAKTNVQARADEPTWLINYLSKFLPKLSQVSQPLRDLTTKKAPFVWSPQHDKSFNEVKLLVTSHPVLKYYDAKEKVML